MTTQTDPNSPLFKSIVREFAEHIGFKGIPEFTCIFVSPVAPDERRVFLVVLGEDKYAIKIDTTSPETGRLQEEFEGLTALNAHFAKYDKLGTATPLYLSPSKTFFVMNYLDYLTAGQRLRGRDQDQTARQVYRRAGLWLSAMHEFKPHKRGQFHGRWMLVELDELLDAGDMQADPQDVRVMRAQLSSQIEKTGNTKELRAWCHGDFHSENIMMGPGMTYAYDVTEARMKMALYDAVDFLKVDVHRPFEPGDVDSSGLISAHREMFFKGYKHKVNQRLFEVAMRGRLLIDWAAITKKRFKTHDGDRRRFGYLQQRLSIAFSQDV